MIDVKESLNKYLQNPVFYTKLIMLRSLSIFLPDKLYIKTCYQIYKGSKLNLSNPHSFSEKLQWLKLYDRNPLYTTLVDKYKVKDYVAKIIGNDHVIPLLGVWDNANEIDFDKLPDKFVLKCNHDSKSWIFCRDKDSFDKNTAIKILNKKLKKSHYLKFREWAYKNVDRKIIAEKYLIDKEDHSGYFGLTDYKFFCTNGKAHMMFITHDIDSNSTFDAFDMNFNHLDMLKSYNDPKTPTKPKFFNEMRKAAEKLSKSIPFVRVDFYVVNNEYYFGEMTFYPMGGFFTNIFDKWDNIIGSWIELKK